MAAPMEMICGAILSCSRANTRNCSRLKLVRAVNACQKCICSYNANCRRYIYATTNIAGTQTEFCNSKIKTGGNPSLLFDCDKANYMIKNHKHMEYVISGKYLTFKRYCVTPSNCNLSTNDRNINDGPVAVKENIWTIPNLLTMSRITLTPVIGYLVVVESFSLALGLFAYAGLTDLLDGFIARNFKNQMSAFGTALDPLADKILITVLTITLAMAHLLPVPLAALIISRDVLLVATGFVIRYVSLPPPITMKRYFDVTNPTAKLLPSTLSKINTMLQLSLVCFTLAAPVFNFVDHPVLQCLWYLTAATTFGSGVGYIITGKQCVKFLQKDSQTTKK